MDLSIVTSLYRSDAFLERYRDHLLQVGQSLHEAGFPFEVVFAINDATPFERQILTALEADTNKPFAVKLLFVEREPLYASWNRGIEASAGKCIAFWNVDDVRTAGAFIQGCEMIRGGCRLIDFPCTLVKVSRTADGATTEERVDYRPFPYDVQGNNPLDRLRTGPFFMFERTLFDEIGPFDPRFRIVGDFEWNVRAARVTKFCRGEAHAGNYYIHGQNLSTSDLLPVEENVVLLLFQEAHHWEGLRPVSAELMRETWQKWNTRPVPDAIEERLWGTTPRQIQHLQQSRYPWIPRPVRDTMRDVLDTAGLRPALARVGVMRKERGFQILNSNQARHPWIPETVRTPLRAVINKTGTRDTFARLGLVRSTAEISTVVTVSAPAAPTAAKGALQTYVDGGRIPWSYGYLEYRAQFIDWALLNDDLREAFRNSGDLPPQYGTRLDERVVEYPWVFTHLSDSPSMLLDAGSTLNHHFLLSKPLLAQKTMIIYTLAPEPVYSSANVSYIYGDLRETILKDALFDEIACVSTLEHVGMDNTRLYTSDAQYQENVREAYLDVIHEFRRLLKPGGSLLLTVPYGREQNLEWQQQFNAEQLETVIEAFGGTVVELTFFRYTADGWQRSSQEDCRDCEYYDIHTGKPFDPDYAAAARAVACVLLKKPVGG